MFIELTPEQRQLQAEMRQYFSNLISPEERAEMEVDRHGKAYRAIIKRMGSDGKLGAFVEVKNSTIGTGTKVPHLTYVGDADIGEHSNIGASSVFVNYDGISKRRTTVGSHVRTGSDTMFVAPVNVGDGAYTGRAR